MTEAAEARVAVIGGGPAGAAACLALGQAGRRVLWIAPPPPAERIGESLSPAAMPLLASLNAEHLARTPPHRSANDAFSAWGSDRLQERNAAASLNGPGLVLNRTAFERDLKAAAEEQAECLEVPLRAAFPEKGQWQLTLADGRGCRTDFLIDCTGRKAMVARRFSERERLDSLMAAYCFLQQVDREVEPTPATLIEAVSDGWWYASLLPPRPVGPPRLVLARFTDSDLHPRGLRRDPVRWRQLIQETLYVSRWVETAGFSLDTAPALASAGTTWLKKLFGFQDGAGWVAAGDAAAAFDPLSSHGLATALWSGRQAAKAADAALNQDSQPLHAYTLAFGQGIATFLADRRRAYAAERRFADKTFWRRRSGKNEPEGG